MAIRGDGSADDHAGCVDGLYPKRWRGEGGACADVQVVCKFDVGSYRKAGRAWERGRIQDVYYSAWLLAVQLSVRELAVTLLAVGVPGVVGGVVSGNAPFA